MYVCNYVYVCFSIFENTYLVFEVSQSKGGMNYGEENRKHYTHQEHRDTAALVDKEVSNTESSQHDQSWVF